MASERDYRDPCSIGKCKEDSVYSFLCKVEGTDTRLCKRHLDEWRRTVQQDTSLAQNCPKCAPAALQRRQFQASSPSVAIADEPLTGPLAIAIESAMLREGVDVLTRRRVLMRLAADQDVYVSSLLAKNFQEAS